MPPLRSRIHMLGQLRRSNFGGALVIACLLWTALVSVAMARAAAQTLDDRVYAVARGLMCPTCAGQTVAESNAPLAQQMRREIRSRLAQGQSAEEIRAFFVAQFGASVLAEPPRRGMGWIVWIAPLAAIALGALAVTVFVRRAVARPH